MKHTLLVLLLFLFVSYCVIAQPATQLLPVKSNYKWGFVSAADGKWAIEAKFDEAEHFKYGVAKVKSGTKYGLINSIGAYVIEPTEDDILILNDKYVSIKEDTLWGVDNIKGDNLLKPQYKSVSAITTDLFLLKNQGDKLGIFNASSTKTTDVAYDKIEKLDPYILAYDKQKVSVFNDSLTYFLNEPLNGAEVIEGALLFFKQKDFWGVCDAKFNIVLKAEWMAYKYVSPKYYMLKAKVGGWHLFSITDKKIITQNPYDDFSLLEQGLFITTKNGKHGLINASGNTILGTNFTNLHLNEGLILAENNGKWGLADKSGKFIIDPVHDRLFPFRKNVAVFEASTGKGIIDNKGKIIAPPVYADINIDEKQAVCIKPDGSKNVLSVYSGAKMAAKSIVINSTNHNHAWLKGASNKWGLVGHDTVLIPFRFDNIIDFSASLALAGVKIDYRQNLKMYGYINQQKLNELATHKYALADKNFGKLIMPLQLWYVRTNDFKSGEYAKAVQESGGQMLVNKQGKVITEFSYTNKEKKLVKYPFTYIGDFSDGIAPYAVNGTLNYAGDWESNQVMNAKWGYIAQDGKFLTEPVFDEASNFSNGVAMVKQKGLYGLINPKMDFVIKPEYVELSFSTLSGFIKVADRKDRYGLIDTNGRILASIEYDKISPYVEDRAKVLIGAGYGFLNRNGELIVAPNFSDALDYSEGMAAVCKDKLWGYLNLQGKQEILPVTSYVGNFKNGLAPALRDGKMAYINKDARIIVPPVYNEAAEFKNGLAIVAANTGKGLIDSTGKVLLEPKFEDISLTSIPHLVVIKTSGEWKVWNVKTKKIISKKSYLEWGNFSEGKATVKGKDFYNYADSNGKLLNAKKYQAVSPFSNGLAKVLIDGKYHFINDKGEDAFFTTFIDATDFNCNHAFVAGANKKWAIINKNGKQITPFIFHSPKPFTHNLAVVSTGKKEFYYVDTLGNNVFKTTFDLAYPFQNNVARVCKNKKWGLVSNQGFNVTPLMYDFMGEFTNGNVTVGINTQNGLFSTSGKLLLDIDYHTLEFVNSDIVKAEKSGAIGYYSTSSEKWIWPLTR